MKKFIKILLLIIAIALVSVALPYSPMLGERLTAQTLPTNQEVREGDIIFQTSKSRQSPLLQVATRSKITHCGIIVMREGKPYVLETLKTLVLTPLDKFIARGEGGRYWLKRADVENVNIEYGKYLGKPYDSAFSFDNDTYYCSELVYDIYLKQLGIKLCEPKKVGDYLILCTDKLPIIEKEMSRRGITTEQQAVAPVDIFESDLLKDVK